MLSASVRREISVVGVETQSHRVIFSNQHLGGRLELPGKPPGRVPLLICAARPPLGNRSPCSPRGWAVPPPNGVASTSMLSENDESDTVPEGVCSRRGMVAGIARLTDGDLFLSLSLLSQLM